MLQEARMMSFNSRTGAVQGDAESELRALNEGNFARYQIRPSEFTAWQQA